jgi:SAM-dependent methyltransferase
MTAFVRSARVYDALTANKNYRRATRSLVQAVQRIAPDARTLLDVGCGTGRHLQHLRDRFDVEGLDLSRQMLAIARKRCPGVRFHKGTVVDFTLSRRFDVVTCLFGSIGYARTLAGLRSAVWSMARHLHPNGVLIVEPWVGPERFITGRVVFDHADSGDLKAARMYVTKRRGTVSIFDSHYLVATAAGVEHFTERQELGLFTDAQYRAAFQNAALTVVASGLDLFGYGVYVCVLSTRPTRPLRPTER